MRPQKETISSQRRIAGFIVIGVFVLVLGLPSYVSSSLAYSETKGPFKNWMKVADINGDGNLDILVSHTRWEEVDISWAGVGRWINNGNGRFELIQDEQMDLFAAYAGGAGDVDQDGDTDIFVQDFGVHLLTNQGGQQGGNTGTFLASSQITPPSIYANGHPDMGGTITTGDLNGDGKIDIFVAGCCYGSNPTRSGYDHISSLSWVWINDGVEKGFQTDHVLMMDFLNGKPIREAALGDVDGDGDLDVFAAVGSPTIGTLDSLDDLILLNDGAGKLTLYEQQLGNADSTSVALGDVNGDARLDALVGTSTGANLWINQSNKMSTGDPMFVPAGQMFESSHTIKNKLQAGISAAADKLFGLYFPYGSTRTKAVFLTDLDGDGDLDALIARILGAEIWWNNGQGEFQQSNIRFPYKEDTGMAIGDFDGDQDADIFTGNNGNDYQVWFNDGRGNFKRTNR